jgi:eukaryotic-like serine/threonine-protein kinase
MAVQTGVFPDRYADARLIGQGGMGEIYRARDRELGRDVAIKLLDERFADDEGLRQRFKREALTAARLSGIPHIVTIFDVGEWKGRPFIVMEYLGEGTLAERARGGVDHAEALEWLEQAAAALDAAHAQGVVHRDVKPPNLLFDNRGELQVADFGIARVIDDTSGGMTAAGTVLGTAGYLSPEQARGEPATPASDRYALAVVAYELLTGGRPFERGSATAEAAAHIRESVPPASERGVGLPPAVDDVLEKALAKDPTRRYGSAASFVSALRQALAAGRPVSRPRVLPPTSPPPAGRRRAPLAAAAVAAGLLLALLSGAVAFALLNDGGSSGGETLVTVTQPVTQTLQGTTLVQTETVATSVAKAPSGGGAHGLSPEEAAALNDEAYTNHMQQGDYEGALPLLRRAVPALRGTYSNGFRYEAYAQYNFGKTLAELGRCDEALPHLERSEQLQGEREPITDAKRQCGG